MHIAIVGTGRLGRVIAYTLVQEDYVSELSLVDIVPNLTKALREELKHVLAGIGKDVEIHAYEEPSEVSNADIILITASTLSTTNSSNLGL